MSEPNDGSLVCGQTYSVVVPAYNAAGTLERALQSVMGQAHEAWELVVVDDGSTDDSAAIAERFAATDERIRVVRQENRGVAAARNVGVATARGELVAFLDADDELLPEFLSSMDRFICVNPDYEIYHPEIVVRHADGAESLRLGVTEVVSYGLDDLLDECVIAVGGSVVRRDLVQSVGGFRSDMHCEDYDFWLRATAGGARALYLPVPLYVYRQDEAGRRSEDALSGAVDVIRSMQGLLDDGLVHGDMVPRVRQAIAVKRVMPDRIRQEQALELQAGRLRAGVERAVGRRAAPVLLKMIHSVSWIVRPLRRAAASRRVRHQ